MEKETHISIIIPTHNRVSSLETLLLGLSQQKFPLHMLEVIVVADGCHATTGELLRTFKAPYTLKYIEQSSQGPAVARNRGAAIASGNVLLFLDDDIAPSRGMVSAHLKAHQEQKSVVIGYLPYQSPKFTGFYISLLRAWWENKFHHMRQSGYRFTYEDLLSGNFSISASFFRELRGFNESLACREDYELGARLLKAGAAFVFSKDAWGYHCDEATDFERSLERKRQEGIADVQLARLHPNLLPAMRFAAFRTPYTRSKAMLLFLVYSAPLLGSFQSWLLRKWLKVLEKARFRGQWHKLAFQLQFFWYMKGVAAQVNTRQQLQQLLQQPPTPVAPLYTLDLKKGITEAEDRLNRDSPTGAALFYGNQFIGNIPSVAGAERLRGRHLRVQLATTLAWPFYQAMLLEGTTPNQDSSAVRIEAPLHQDLTYNQTLPWLTR